jgi:hypothetical protein
LENIIENYVAVSRQAHSDFMQELNFENHFNPVIHYLQETGAQEIGVGAKSFS